MLLIATEEIQDYIVFYSHLFKTEKCMPGSLYTYNNYIYNVVSDDTSCH